MEACKGPSGYLFILAMMVMVFIMFTPSVGDSMASFAGIVLDPVIGFGGRYPVLTLVLAGGITVIISTATRHFMVDWIDLAKKQRTMNEFNKQVREATKKGDTARSQKLNEQNQEILAMQSAMMMDQLKSSVITMIVAILIFRWLFSFIQGLEHPLLAVPWDIHFPLLKTALGSVCGGVCGAGAGSEGGIPYWILLYIILTIPFGQALMRGLKYYEFSRKLKAKGHDVFGTAPEKEAKEVSKKKDKKDLTPKEKAQKEREELRRK